MTALATEAGPFTCRCLKPITREAPANGWRDEDGDQHCPDGEQHAPAVETDPTGEPMTMTADRATCMTPDGSWADELTRKERRTLAAMLARACHRFYNTPAGTSGAMLSQIIASAEMSDLHMDVTERAAVPSNA